MSAAGTVLLKDEEFNCTNLPVMGCTSGMPVSVELSVDFSSHFV